MSKRCLLKWMADKGRSAIRYPLSAIRDPLEKARVEDSP